MSTRDGFTLVELTIVIGVISVLASVLIFILNPFTQFQKAHDAQRKSDLAHIQRALEQYYNDNQQYPAGSGSGGSPKWSIVDPVSNPTLPNIIPFGSKWGTYMQVLPQDPAGNKYAYKTEVSNQVYFLYASLERNNDPQLCIGDGGVTYGGFSKPCSHHAPSGSTGCGAWCNYGVGSPNETP